MAQTTTLQDELDALQETLDEAVEILEEAYVSEATREELAEAVGKALEVLTGDEEETGEGEDDTEELAA